MPLTGTGQNHFILVSIISSLTAMLPRRPFRLGVALLWAGAMVIGLRGAGYIGTLLDIPSVVQRTGVDSEQPQHIVDSFPLAGHGYGTEHFSK